MSDLIRYERDGAVGIVTINRPDKRNAMTYAMLGEFLERIAEAGADTATRVVVITGTAGAFCAGTDLADLATVPGAQRGLRGTAQERTRWWPIVDCPKPVIGAIDGPAVGMGAEFSSQCDIRIASPNARFAWNFVHRGLVPDTGAGSWLLPRLIGLQRALRLLYTGEFLSAEEALAIGYVARGRSKYGAHSNCTRAGEDDRRELAIFTAAHQGAGLRGSRRGRGGAHTTTYRGARGVLQVQRSQRRCQCVPGAAPGKFHRNLMRTTGGITMTTILSSSGTHTVVGAGRWHGAVGFACRFRTRERLHVETGRFLPRRNVYSDSTTKAARLPSRRGDQFVCVRGTHRAAAGQQQASRHVGTRRAGTSTQRRAAVLGRT